MSLVHAPYSAPPPPPPQFLIREGGMSDLFSKGFQLVHDRRALYISLQRARGSERLTPFDREGEGGVNHLLSRGGGQPLPYYCGISPQLLSQHCVGPGDDTLNSHFAKHIVDWDLEMIALSSWESPALHLRVGVFR